MVQENKYEEKRKQTSTIERNVGSCIYKYIDKKKEKASFVILGYKL